MRIRLRRAGVFGDADPSDPTALYVNLELLRAHVDGVLEELFDGRPSAFDDLARCELSGDGAGKDGDPSRRCCGQVASSELSSFIRFRCLGNRASHRRLQRVPVQVKRPQGFSSQLPGAAAVPCKGRGSPVVCAPTRSPPTVHVFYPPPL